MANTHLTIDLRGWPEVIWAIRREMAHVLREEADGEINPAVSRKLRELAAAFEAGATGGVP